MPAPRKRYEKPTLRRPPPSNEALCAPMMVFDPGDSEREPAWLPVEDSALKRFVRRMALIERDVREGFDEAEDGNGDARGMPTHRASNALTNLHNILKRAWDEVEALTSSEECG